MGSDTDDAERAEYRADEDCNEENRRNPAHHDAEHLLALEGRIFLDLIQNRVQSHNPAEEEAGQQGDNRHQNAVGK